MFKVVLRYCCKLLAVFVISSIYQVYAGDETLTEVIKRPRDREIPAAVSGVTFKEFTQQSWVVELFNLAENDYGAAHHRLDWMNEI